MFVAEDGKEMTKLWQREHFDLLVLDLMLPGEDGLSICRRLRGANDNTPIIMLTAKPKRSIASWAWRWVLTIICPSRSILVNCSRG